MSLDFDSGALQTQHEDEEEYDKEDYAREQELQQLLTDLPHDMLDDSQDLSSPDLNYSDCSVNEISERAQSWEQETRWTDPVITNPQRGYDDEYTENQYHEQYMYENPGTQGDNLVHQLDGDNCTNEWSGHPSKNEDGSMFDIKYSYPRRQMNEGSDGTTYHNGEGYPSMAHYQPNSMYHLPEDFQPYKNNHKKEVNSMQGEKSTFPDSQREHYQRFIVSEVASSQPGEPYQVKYNPYQATVKHKVPVTQETSRDERFEELQRDFLDTGESSADNIQIAQIHVLYKARGRKLEEIHAKLEESGRENRYLNHQLAMVRDEKDGLVLSLQESQKLLQNGKEREVQLEGQIKALETTVQTFTANEEQTLKKLKVAEVAMEGMQQQLLELRRSDSLQRAREQHEAVVTMLQQKNEEQVLALQQKLDAANSALQEQKELCCHLEDHVKQLERKQDEIKLEKTDIINRLTKSLEESQKQCANLLQTGSIQETTHLRIQLQQAQSSKMINDDMNKALQLELTELKEQITLYESAAKLGVFLNEAGRETEVDMSESYVDLGIKKVNWKKSQFHSSMHKRDPSKNLSKDDLILELKTELERALNSNKMKRQQISRLQNELKEYRAKAEELKHLTARDYEIRSDIIGRKMDPLWPCSSTPGDAFQEDMEKLKRENQSLQLEVEKHLSCIQELRGSEEKLKGTNQELCNEMRQMIQDFDQDKQEAMERCERTYQQHHEDVKSHLVDELSAKYVAEKEQIAQNCEERVSQLKAELAALNQEMSAVQECYIAVCREKNTLQDTLRDSIEEEVKAKEEQLKEEREVTFKTLTADLEEKHRSALVTARNQWLKEKEIELKQHVEVQVAVARAHWEEEQRKVTEQTIQEIEKNWQHRLDKIAEEMKKNPIQLEDCQVQTEWMGNPVEILSESSREVVEQLNLKLRDAVEEKKKAVREALMTLETQHCENIAVQVETAVKKARARWLEELTSLAEYKANLKSEQENWEKEHKLGVAKQITAAEEKWKKDHLKMLERSEKAVVNMKQRELEEKVLSLRRELELKNEELPAMIKVELATARAQWNKEKQEEIYKMQEQNERDYRAFLDDHRTRIAEVLALAKNDFERQKTELRSQKESEIKERLEQNREEWMVQETKKLQKEREQQENEIFAELEYILKEIHEELDKGTFNSCTSINKLPNTSCKLSIRCREKLRACLLQAYRDAVHKILDHAKQEWKKQNEENIIESLKYGNVYPDQKQVGTSGELKRLQVKGHHKEKPLRKTPENDQYCTEINLHPEEYSCCRHYFQQLEESKNEVQELKRKLEKVCRHLQMTVREHKARGEQIKENEAIVDSLKRKNLDLKKKLEELRMPCNKTPSLQLDEGYGNFCSFCNGQGLEEMRSQYIRAVDKIRGDMLRYIHESKKRAAEMLKAEVLRERQETARKMRKYYLVCLQQLLKDDGSLDGAEKRIMNAASKLVTMAKVLESPICHRPQGKNKPEQPPVEESEKRNISQTHASHMDSRSDDKCVVTKVSSQKSIPCNLSLKLNETGRFVPCEEVPFCIGKKSTSEKCTYFLKEVIPGSHDEDDEEKAASVVKNTQNQQTSTNDTTTIHNSLPHRTQGMLKPTHAGRPPEAELAPGAFCNEREQADLEELNCNQPKRYQRVTSAKGLRFDVQEMPVKDQAGSDTWRLCGRAKLDSSAVPLLNPVQSENTQAQSLILPGHYSATILRSEARESGDAGGRELVNQNDPVQAGKRKINHSNKERVSKIVGLNLPQNTDDIISEVTKSSHPVQYPDAGKIYKEHLKKLALDAISAQQDSGIDSPYPGFPLNL
ncbi:centrosomal protein of 152 kDa isoform X2 [Rhinatrema bivittatum]|uniref:centrosomal protein of 152 kDa isoform X2 n=1 Tax=Rhinatrema bivittatum TaxID=194408 RepID=UPI00112CD436|nr:centrosomal protein of 152 kDa isoform X2 [Rhinatrema bivittatum]XP_029430991.1 centrosomal protein of 152 kDa isoform X2 [Rhinatrema bivittatum]